jgi:hypothetical protein
MSGLLSPLLFRKSGSKTLNAAYIKKAVAKSLAIFKLKRSELLSPDWFLCRENAPIHNTASVWESKWATATHSHPISEYPPIRIFSLVESGVGAG